MKLQRMTVDHFPNQNPRSIKNKNNAESNENNSWKYKVNGLDKEVEWRFSIYYGCKFNCNTITFWYIIID